MKQAVVFERLCDLLEVLDSDVGLALKVGDDVPLFAVQVFEVLQLFHPLDRVPRLLLHKLEEGFGVALASVLSLGDLAIHHVLQSGVLGDVEPRTKAACCSEWRRLLPLVYIMNLSRLANTATTHTPFDHSLKPLSKKSSTWFKNSLNSCAKVKTYL